MTKLMIEFRSRERPSPAVWVGIMLIGVGLILLFTVVWDNRRSNDALRIRATEQQQLRPELPVKPAIPRYFASALDAYREAMSTWPEQLTALETVAARGMKIVSIEAAPAEQQVQVEVVATDYESLLAIVAELNRGEPKPRWSLIRAQLETHAAMSGIRATVRADASP